MTRWLITVILGLVIAGPLAGAQELTLQGPSKRLQLSLKDLRSKLKTHVVKLDDPYTKKMETYDAFDLRDVLDLAGIGKEGEVILACDDGYAPVLKLDFLKSHRGYVAYQEHGTDGKFTPWYEGKTLASPAPFYVVWQEGKKLRDVAPWPARLTKISVAEAKADFSLAEPKGAAADSASAKGYAIFKFQCLTCHSMNLQGGEVGPELNIPKNVTEYWRPELLKPYIRNPFSFHAKSRMPGFSHLTDEELDQVIAYLKYMKDHKVKPKH